MSTLTINSSASLGNNAGYFDNLLRASRKFLEALFAVQPSVKLTNEEKARAVSVMRLYRLASSYDSLMPNMAQELRAIAQRA